MKLFNTIDYYVVQFGPYLDNFNTIAICSKNVFNFTRKKYVNKSMYRTGIELIYSTRRSHRNSQVKIALMPPCPNIQN